MLETKKPMFDNEFMSIVQRPNGKTRLVYTSVLKTEPTTDAVMILNLPSKFMAGIAHFKDQPTLDEI